MTLVEAPVGKDLEVIKINAGEDARRKLHTLGLHIDDKLKRLTNGKWGPVLISNISGGAVKIALGRGLAGKILVKPIK